jgi:hypothetical protein
MLTRASTRSSDASVTCSPFTNLTTGPAAPRLRGRSYANGDGARDRLRSHRIAFIPYASSPSIQAEY